MSKLPTASRFSLVNELQDSFSSHVVLYGHAGHRPMDDEGIAFSGPNGAGYQQPQSDDDVLAEGQDAQGVSPGGRSLESVQTSQVAMLEPSESNPTPAKSVADPEQNGVDSTVLQVSSANDELQIRYTGLIKSLDESAYLQNAQLGLKPSDLDDNDVHIDALPATFAARLAELGLGNPAHAALTGFDGFSGGNAFEFDSSANTVVMALVDKHGQVLNGLDSALKTVTGEAIYLFSDVHNPGIVLGKTSTGEVVLAVYLEHTETDVQGGALWSILYQPLEHPDPLDSDEAVDLSGLLYASVSVATGAGLQDVPSGNHLFFMVGDAQQSYVVTGKQPANQSAGEQVNKGDTVNVSQANGTSSLGVNNQMIDPDGEGLFITFVSDSNPAYTGSELSQTEADREINIQFGALRSVNAAYFVVNQTQAAVQDAFVEVAAWNTNAGSGAAFIEPSVLNIPVAINRVRVLDDSLNVLEDSNGSVDSAGISINIEDGVATLTGIKAGYLIEYQTVDSHNRMSITNPDAGKNNKIAAFDVGGFGTGVIQTQYLEVGQLLHFEDDAPFIGAPETAYLDSKTIEIDGESQTVITQTGRLNLDYGADDSGGFQWLSTGAPEGFSYDALGNLLNVYRGESLVMSVLFNPLTNQYEATQHELINSGSTGNLELPLSFEIFDGDGDSTQGQLNLLPELAVLTLDPPTLTLTGNRVALDETTGLQNLANSTAPGDQDDNDIAASELPIPMLDRLQAIGAGTPTYSALSGYDGTAGKPLATIGGDLPSLTGLSFSNVGGLPLNGEDSGLFTLTGEPIYLYTDELDPTLLLGKTADSELVMAAYLEVQDGLEPGVFLWTALYEPLQHPDPTNPDEAVDLSGRVFIKTGGETTYDLSDVKPGQFLFFMTGDENVALLFTGKEPANQSEGEKLNSGDTVNTSAATTTTVGTNNQMIEPPTYDKFGEVVNQAEGVVVTFVSGANPAYTGINLSPSEAGIEANIQFSGLIDLQQARFVVSQLQPVKSATVEVSAWRSELETSTQFVDGLLTDDTPINITRVTVYDENGMVLEDSDGSVENSAINITIVNGVANITGINAGYQIEYQTDVAHNRVLIENAGSRNENLNSSFDIGAFTLSQVNTTVTEIGSAILFEDDGVTITPTDTVYLDDDALTGGNPGGIGDQDPDGVAATGTLGHSFGADQPGSIAWLTAGAPVGFTYEASGSDLLVKQGMTTVMTLSLDTATGAYAVVQNAAVMHEAGMDENDQAFTVGYRVTDADGDATDGSVSIMVNDDTPVVTENATVYLDDDALTGGNPGGIGDQDPDVVAATGTLGHSFGADQPGSIAWLTAGAPVGFTYEASGSDLLVKQGAVTVLTLSLDASTGAYAVVQNAAVQHETALNENDQAFTVGYRVTDADGDATDGSVSIMVNDDTPVVNEVTGVAYFNSENPVPGAYGVFDYSVGADSRQDYSATNTDLLMFRLTGTVGVNSITNSSVTWVSESDDVALFKVDFDYQPSESSVEISSSSGYIEFDKVEGTYQFWLDEPLQGFSISTTSSALGFTGYEVNTEITDKTQPEVMVTQLNNTLYAQFTGYSEIGGGTGSNNLQATGVDSDSNAFVDGEQFVQASSYVSVSNVSNGVAGDTLQKGEVLNFTLHSSNPYGYLDGTPSESAESMFLKFDGIGNTEDLVVVLSLIDSDTLQETTRALIVDSNEILKIGNSITPDYRIVLDNNDGAIIIESNDFNAAGESYLITGAQMLVSVEGVTGEGIVFNSLIGDEGASTTTRAFGLGETDGDVIKISDIGVMTQSSSVLSADLKLDLAVIDSDFDASATQSIDIAILGSSMAPLDMSV